jgi:DNA-binding transcriptional LysR family regulator
MLSMIGHPSGAEPLMVDVRQSGSGSAGVPAPRRAPPLGTFATVIAHIAAGDGWLVSARTLARHIPPGLVAKPLAVTPRHKLQFEIIWHVNTDPATINAFSARIQQALA